MNGISALIKGTPIELSGPLQYMRIQQEDGSLQHRKGPSPEPNHTGTLILKFYSLQNYEK